MLRRTKQPVIIQIPRKAIEACDCSGVTEILESFVPNLWERNRNRVEIEVLGYNADPREIYDIPEIRRYFIKLFDEYDGLFYWINFYSHMPILIALLLFTPNRVDGMVTVSSNDLQQYLLYGFSKLNEYCKQHGMGSDASTELINNWVREQSEN